MERPTVVLLGTDDDDRHAWLVAGRALGRVLLLATAAGVAASPLTQALDWPATRTRLSSRLSLVGHPQMLLRMGYPPERRRGAISGRRPVDEVLRFEPAAEPRRGQSRGAPGPVVLGASSAGASVESAAAAGARLPAGGGLQRLVPLAGALARARARARPLGRRPAVGRAGRPPPQPQPGQGQPDRQHVGRRPLGAAPAQVRSTPATKNTVAGGADEAEEGQDRAEQPRTGGGGRRPGDQAEAAADEVEHGAAACRCRSRRRGRRPTSRMPTAAAPSRYGGRPAGAAAQGRAQQQGAAEDERGLHDERGVHQPGAPAEVGAPSALITSSARE